jgi:hypothetical protein
MPRVPSFHSTSEARKLPPQRVYHENDSCSLARNIPEWDIRPGTGGHRLCKECERLNRSGPPRSSNWL